MKRIVILGGGFGGAYCAQALERRLGESDAEVLLIDRNNYFIFYPLLVEAGNRRLSPGGELRNQSRVLRSSGGRAWEHHAAAERPGARAFRLRNEEPHRRGGPPGPCHPDAGAGRRLARSGNAAGAPALRRGGRELHRRGGGR